MSLVSLPVSVILNCLLELIRTYRTEEKVALDVFYTVIAQNLDLTQRFGALAYYLHAHAVGDADDASEYSETELRFDILSYSLAHFYYVNREIFQIVERRIPVTEIVKRY